MKHQDSNYSENHETCEECGAEVEEIFGCPDGTEVCQECFDRGAH